MPYFLINSKVRWLNARSTNQTVNANGAEKETTDDVSRDT